MTAARASAKIYSITENYKLEWFEIFMKMGLDLWSLFGRNDQQFWANINLERKKLQGLLDNAINNLIH